MKWLRSFGPGILVTAAFIGPGTVTTASRAGAQFGYALLWVVLFSVLAAIVLQEMSARLGLVTRQGLGEALRSTFTHPVLRTASAALVIGAIAIGNGAYQMGNIAGASIGLEALTGMPREYGALATGLAALLMLGLGGYLTIERLLIVLVALMSVLFIVTAMVARPDASEVLSGLLSPRMPAKSTTTVIALLGTTVVPYNLFLHASSVREKWGASVPLDRALRESRLDTTVAVGIGGIITVAILVTAAAVFEPGSKIESLADMAHQLKPLLGGAANACVAAGLTAAGLTSAVTAPLAAAYATAGVLGWKDGLKSRRFRAVWAVIVIAGTLLAVLGRKPLEVIMFAQAANGILLPVMAIFLIIVMNRTALLGEHRNRIASNVVGMAVVLIAAGLGVMKIVKLF
ncbi:MAG: Nramp family divalent metal transporter [Planctomycetes bacterium]|nr:Nramp family divalent metal transporter [Planctomycetota bacterium]